MFLWELTTYGMSSFPELNSSLAYDLLDTETSRELYNLLETGYHMNRPEACPPPIYNLIKFCWELVRDNRPSFEEVSVTLNSIA